MKNTLATCLVTTAALVLPLVGTLRGQATTGSVPPVPENRAPNAAAEQPLPFSHQWHAGSLGLACQFCHTNPAAGVQMTFPATAICMSCHSSVATDHPTIKKLTQYASSKQLIPWVRVYEVLPGVTWSHRAHLRAGLRCEVCHGPVRDLPVMVQVTAVTSMASCISCHQAKHASTECSTCHAWPAAH